MAKKHSSMTTTKDTISRKRLKQSASHATKTAKEHEDSQKDIRLKRTGSESASTVLSHSGHEILDVGSSVQCPVSKKLPGAYKGTRKHSPPKAVVIIECPACGWRTQPNELQTAEIEYVLHIENIHHGILSCAFCDPTATNRGQRILPTFETLAAHVRHFHPERFHDCAEDTMGAIPRKAFR